MNYSTVTDLARLVAQIMHCVELTLQWYHAGIGQRQNTILASLAAADRNRPMFESQLLDPQPQVFHQALTSASAISESTWPVIRNAANWLIKQHFNITKTIYEKYIKREWR